jgi:hypothetical protein
MPDLECKAKKRKGLARKARFVPKSSLQEVISAPGIDSGRITRKPEVISADPIRAITVEPISNDSRLVMSYSSS